jgi:hypothetical protein
MGNGRIRCLLVEAVWRFLKWQPGWKSAQRMKVHSHRTAKLMNVRVELFHHRNNVESGERFCESLGCRFSLAGRFRVNGDRQSEQQGEDGRAHK